MVTHDHGSTAIAGIVYYAADQFPAGVPRTTSSSATSSPTGSTATRLEWHGSTPQGDRGSPISSTSDDPWFRPVDIKLGPDGALYVADFYNRIIGHYEVP